MMVLGDNRIQAGVQPLNNHVKPSCLNACAIMESVCLETRGSATGRARDEEVKKTHPFFHGSVHDLKKVTDK